MTHSKTNGPGAADAAETTAATRAEAADATRAETADATRAAETADATRAAETAEATYVAEISRASNGDGSHSRLRQPPARVSNAESPLTTRSSARPRSARAKRIAWTPDRLWFALRSDDKKRLAARLGCGVSNVYARVHGFRATSPGGSGFRHVIDRDIHLVMARMLDGARHEALAAVAFVSPSPPPVFDHLLAAAVRGVEVRLLFRSDNLNGDLVRSLQRGGVSFRILADLHAKFLITDTTAMNGSANFTQASADRASEVATFFSNPTLVYDLRKVFTGYWQRARPY